MSNLCFRAHLDLKLSVLKTGRDLQHLCGGIAFFTEEGADLEYRGACILIWSDQVLINTANAISAQHAPGTSQYDTDISFASSGRDQIGLLLGCVSRHYGRLLFYRSIMFAN
jgi:hypothetical protein